MSKLASTCSSKNMLIGTVFSKSGIRLLKLFIFKSGIEIHQAEAINRSGLSRMTATKFLKAFKDNGILKESKRGDLKLYSINEGNPVVKQLKIFVNITEIYESIKELSDKEAEVFLFGSTARGEDTEESDIDLLIVTGFDKSMIMKVIDKLRNNVNREINPVIYTSMEYSRLEHTDKVFYEKFEKDKIRLL